METKFFCYNPFCKYHIEVVKKTSFLNIPKWTQISYPNGTSNISNSLVTYEKITRHCFYDNPNKKFTYFCSYCKQHLDLSFIINVVQYLDTFKDIEFWESELLKDEKI